ncbi:tRNA (N(6)-L-threonylcarbamoyladenosine(37)-C(2))-methylthiotransferase MtaB [Cycloclasticus pugetii]|uniref:tRNA (N(6)-L-threonylcarbamoyladenosine(37)-C(2))- methylthiotransferase MtaB n=1 Tax=Cycloclasticus pugetii TaxID=34068 RepID=UPI0009216769|nr:tRNA (N(6)-L-threonylcarbamoyladenosine(37)-C(2))-methylthiotransferase MtaB [Cycloclasticus pugetii]SHI39201.1 threonylcarbamoyladenosine tRNA methylthiotransferase MtaB [Cycloclasticus pugetii]|tara:strand:- start:6399 stop:7685 length:1287 start_codon:yes stop_codon:yes gene_type:complete
MRVHLKTLGCRLNEAEIESWANDFVAEGHQLVNQETEADILVLNTCAVTQGAVRKSRQLVRKTHQKNPRAKLVVSGCYATLNEQETVALDGVDLLVNNQQKDQLVTLTLNELSEETMPSIATEPNEVALFSRGRQRAFIKVQDGCRYRCSFCIVTIARGDEKSKSIDSIVAEANVLHQQGISEIVITGVHLGGYGSDTGSNLYNLVTALLQQTSIPRIRMGSLEPWDLPQGFLELFKNPRLMPHMHLPIQSGSDTVLKRMSRRCKTSEFRALVLEARKIMPNINITSDIIVGFPSETDDEWQQTLDFVQEMQFGDLHIFTYSTREGTKAASMPNQISTQIKKSRSQALHTLAASAKRAQMDKLVGHTVNVLWEDSHQVETDGVSTLFGYSPNYLRVKITSTEPEKLSNQIIPCKLTSIENNVFNAELA